MIISGDFFTLCCRSVGLHIHVHCTFLHTHTTNDILQKNYIKGTVSRDGMDILPYIFRKLLKNAKIHDFIKGPVNHEHLKDWIQRCTRYCIPKSMVYSKLRCSKVTTLVRCQRYGLEIDAYFSPNRTVFKTEKIQFAGLNNSHIFS